MLEIKVYVAVAKNGERRKAVHYARSAEMSSELDSTIQVTIGIYKEFGELKLEQVEDVLNVLCDQLS